MERLTHDAWTQGALLKFKDLRISGFEDLRIWILQSLNYRLRTPRLICGVVAGQDVQRRSPDAIRVGSCRLANRRDAKASRWTIGLLQEGILTGSHGEETRSEQKDRVSHV